MNITSLSSNSSAMAAEWQTRHQQLQTDMTDLESALASGDIDGAKRLVADIESLKPKDVPANAKGTNPLEKDLAALEQALDAGDVDGAKSALSTLKTGFGHHGKHHGRPAATSSTTGSTDALGSLLDSLSKSSGDDTDATSSFFAVVFGKTSNSNGDVQAALNSFLQALGGNDTSASSVNQSA